MESKFEKLGYDVVFNPPGDGNCFYSSAASALKIPLAMLKSVVFDHLKENRYDVSIFSLPWYDKDKSVLVKWQRFCQNPILEIDNTSQLPIEPTAQSGGCWCYDSATKVIYFVDTGNAILHTRA